MRSLALVLTALLLGACVQTRVAGYVDPAYRGGPKIGSMVVAADTQRLGEREALEGAAVAELGKRGVRAVRMIDLVPPTRPGGPQVEAAAIRTAGVRAVLRIAVDQRGVTARFIPPTYVSDPFFPYGGFGYGYGYGPYRGPFTGPVTGGGWVQEPTARYDATLEDTGNQATIWKADAVARGNSSADFADLAAKVAQDLVDRLQRDGVI